MKTNKEKFLELVEPCEPGTITPTMKDVRRRIKYRKYYRAKQWIILRWLVLLDAIKKKL